MNSMKLCFFAAVASGMALLSGAAFANDMSKGTGDTFCSSGSSVLFTAAVSARAEAGAMVTEIECHTSTGQTVNLADRTIAPGDNRVLAINCASDNSLKLSRSNLNPDGPAVNVQANGEYVSCSAFGDEGEMGNVEINMQVCKGSINNPLSLNCM